LVAALRCTASWLHACGTGYTGAAAGVVLASTARRRPISG
jgi:hypothetical protein